MPNPTRQLRRVAQLPFWPLGSFTRSTAPVLFWVAVVATALQAMVPVAFTVATGYLVQAVADDNRGHALRALVLYGVVAVLTQVVTPIHEWAVQTLGILVDQRVRKRLVSIAMSPATVAHLEDPVYRDRMAAVQGLTNGGNSLPAACAALFRLAGPWFAAFAFGLILLSFRWYLPLLLLAAGGVVRTIMRRQLAYITDAVVGHAQDLRRVAYLSRLGLQPEAAKEIRVFGLGPWLLDTYRERWRVTMRAAWRERRNLRRSTVLNAALLLQNAALVLVLLVIGAASFDARLSIGELNVLLGAAMNLTFAFLNYNQSSIQVEFGVKGLPALREMEARATALDLPSGARAVTGMPKASIRFDDVCFRYPGTDRDIYSGLSLEIRAGESLAVVGVNGAGKTTLVKLLARLYDPTAGQITVDGVPLRDLDVEAWQRNVAAIFQDFVRYPVSARDNVRFGAFDRAPTDAAVESALTLAGVSNEIAALPAGLDTVLDRQFDGGAELSGGQWQRVALARALLAVRAGAGVLVLDEPTASLDVRAEAHMFDRFLELTAGATTVIVSHRFSTVRRASRIVVLDGGKVVEDGTHDELMARGGHYARMFSLQSARFADASDELTADADADASVVTA